MYGDPAGIPQNFIRRGYDIDKKKMQLPNPIKALGTTAVPIKLHPKVTAELKVMVKEA